MKTFLDWSTDRLGRSGIRLPRLEAEVLLAGTLSLSREEIYRAPERVLSEAERSILQTCVERRLHREPMAYILGHREFWSLDFKVTPSVLVPRPETETLIESLLAMYAVTSVNGPVRILDIGTGSGIVAVVAAREIPESQVTATDFSSEALAVARENASAHGVFDQISFVQADLFIGAPEPPYDFIVSNPPYIETGCMHDLMPDIRDFEPRTALDGGIDGLDFYRRIVPDALNHLKTGGGLILEIGETQAEAVSNLLHSEEGYESIKVTRDIGGYDRVVSARKRTNG